MKKLFALGIFALVILLNGCRDRAVTPEQIPASIMSFIQQRFRNYVRYLWRGSTGRGRSDC